MAKKSGTNCQEPFLTLLAGKPVQNNQNCYKGWQKHTTLEIYIKIQAYMTGCIIITIHLQQETICNSYNCNFLGSVFGKLCNTRFKQDWYLQHHLQIIIHQMQYLLLAFT